MRTAVWVVLAVLAQMLVASIGARLSFFHVLPDAMIVATVFMALHRTPVQTAIGALVLGYVFSRQALAPSGLYETALVAMGILVYIASDSLMMRGPVFFALMSGAAAMIHQLLVTGLSLVFADGVGFYGLPTVSLLPCGLSTTLLAALCHKPMLALERRLLPERHQEVLWR